MPAIPSVPTTNVFGEIQFCVYRGLLPCVDFSLDTMSISMLITAPHYFCCDLSTKKQAQIGLSLKVHYEDIQRMEGLYKQIGSSLTLIAYNSSPKAHFW